MGAGHALHLLSSQRWPDQLYTHTHTQVLLGFVKSAVVEDLGITKADEAWMLGVSLGTSGLGAFAALGLGGMD